MYNAYKKKNLIIISFMLLMFILTAFGIFGNSNSASAAEVNYNNLYCIPEDNGFPSDGFDNTCYISSSWLTAHGFTIPAIDTNYTVGIFRFKQTTGTYNSPVSGMYHNFGVYTLTVKYSLGIFNSGYYQCSFANSNYIMNTSLNVSALFICTSTEFNSMAAVSFGIYAGGLACYFDDIGTGDSVAFYNSSFIPLSNNISKSFVKSFYNVGYDTGYTAGETTGLDAGYASGYTAGYTAGETAGYSDGLSFGETIGYDNGYVDGEIAGNESGYNTGYYAGETAGEAAGEITGYNAGYASGQTAGYETGFAAGVIDGIASGYETGYTEGAASVETSIFDTKVSDCMATGLSVSGGLFAVGALLIVRKILI